MLVENQLFNVYGAADVSGSAFFGPRDGSVARPGLKHFVCTHFPIHYIGVLNKHTFTQLSAKT